MYVFLLMRTGLVHVGIGRRQHMSKLHDNADARRAQVCAPRALVILGNTFPTFITTARVTTSACGRDTV